MSNTKQETKEDRQTRLRHVLELLENFDRSVFLDLCELVLMFSDDVDGSIKWDHPRCVVHIRQKVSAARIAKKRGVSL